MTRSPRLAAYIRVNPGRVANGRDRSAAEADAAVALVAQRATICQAARARGWPQPTVYLDVDSHGNGTRPGRPALARLTTAISTGQHDVLLVGVGTICDLDMELAALLARCARHGVAVECITPQVGATSGTGERSHPYA